MRIAWCTDIHLNFVRNEQRHAFYESLSEYDAVLLTGDIAEAPSIIVYTTSMQNTTGKPVYYVLGNHDFYDGSQKEVTKLCKRARKLGNGYYIGDATEVKLTPEASLIGVDGWADARAGDFVHSWVRMNDANYIAELANAAGYNQRYRSELRQEMQRISDLYTAKFDKTMKRVLGRKNSPKIIYIATHIPPFPEACRYKGQRSEDSILPFYCNVGLGECLLKWARSYPNKVFKVYCGHTHSYCIYQKLDNLQVNVGEAAYQNPAIAGVIEL